MDFDKKYLEQLLDGYGEGYRQNGFLRYPSQQRMPLMDTNSELLVQRQGVICMWTWIKKIWNRYWAIMEKGTGIMDL